mgnify:CR=1 FL=1
MKFFQKRSFFSFMIALGVGANLFCGAVLTARAEVIDYQALAEANLSIPVESNEIKNWPEGPILNARSAILMDADSGAILYAKNIHEKLYPASTTKILTAYIARQNSELNEMIEYSDTAVHSIDWRSDSNIGIKAGEAITMEQSLYGLLVGSGSECGNAIGEHISGSMEAFVDLMNQTAKELGCTIFDVQNGKMTLDFDKNVIRKLWDNYYVPFVKGWFAAIGRFRSDDIKVGNVLAYVGSSSSATFFPAQVMVNDTESYDIDMTVLPSPKFAGGEDVAVQQGAGMVVTAGTEEEINASVEFLKWFTQPEHNISFSVDSGYLPVTTAANDMEAIKTSGLELSPKMERILSNAVQSVKNNTLYTPSAFAGGNKARKVLEYSLSDLASADRATVQERVAAGQPAADAEAEFLTDEYFDAWYGGICTALEKYAG